MVVFVTMKTSINVAAAKSVKIVAAIASHANRVMKENLTLSDATLVSVVKIAVRKSMNVGIVMGVTAPRIVTTMSIFVVIAVCVKVVARASFVKLAIANIIVILHSAQVAAPAWTLADAQSAKAAAMTALILVMI